MKMLPEFSCHQDIGDMLPELPLSGILPNESWLLAAVQGKDASGFLQRMLCCNMDKLTPERALLGAWCDIGGRVKCLLLIFLFKQRMFIFAPRATALPMVQALGKFILRDDVQIAESDELEVGGIVGDYGRPQYAWQVHENESDGIDIHMPGPYPHCLQLRQRHNHSASDDGKHGAQAEWEQAWRLLDVASGIPWQFEQECCQQLPQALGLERLGAVDFDKGCYPGQEVIIRLQHKGTTKRGLYCYVASEPIPSGAVATGADGQPAAEILYNAKAMATEAQHTIYPGLLVATHSKANGKMKYGQIELQLYQLPSSAI